MDAHPGVEGAQPAQRQVGVEGAAGEAEGVGPEPQPVVDVLRRGDGDATDDVGVPVDELGGGVHHDVGAVLQRALVQRREERVVRRDHRTDGVGGVGDLADVGDPQERVGRRLDPDKGGGPVERGAERGIVVEVDEVDLEPALPGEEREESPCAAVGIVLDDDTSAARHERLGDQGDGGKPGRHRGRTDAALEDGDRVVELVTGGVAGAGVVVGAWLADALEGVVGAQVDGRHDRSVGRVLTEPGAHALGPPSEFRHRGSLLPPRILRPPARRSLGRFALSGFRGSFAIRAFKPGATDDEQPASPSEPASCSRTGTAPTDAAPSMGSSGQRQHEGPGKTRAPRV